MARDLADRNVAYARRRRTVLLLQQCSIDVRDVSRLIEPLHLLIVTYLLT